MEYIYRLANEAGEGVFTTSAAESLPDDLYRNAYAHPGPRSNEEMDENGDYPLAKTIWNYSSSRFGFATLEQGRSWFSPVACDHLERLGIRLWIFAREECRHLTVGNSQCVFIPPKDGPLGLLPATALHWTPDDIRSSLTQTSEALIAA